MRNMRLAKREVTETEALRQILEDCDVVRLGLTDEDGMFIVPVNFGYELSEENGARKLRLYIHSAKEGRKAYLRPSGTACGPLIWNGRFRNGW